MAVRAFRHIFGGAFRHEVAACLPSFWTEVYDVVSTFDDVHVVLNDEDGVSSSDEGVEGIQQFVDVVEVESGGWLVKDEQGGV